MRLFSLLRREGGKERERESVCVCEREREREREREMDGPCLSKSTKT